MKIASMFLAVTGFAFLSYAAPSPALVKGSCGNCDTVPNGFIGGYANVPLYPFTDHSTGRAPKCTTLQSQMHLTNCVNQFCGLCMMFSDKDCHGDVLWWGTAGSEFNGRGARSFFCV